MLSPIPTSSFSGSISKNYSYGDHNSLYGAGGREPYCRELADVLVDAIIVADTTVPVGNEIVHLNCEVGLDKIVLEINDFALDSILYSENCPICFCAWLSLYVA